MHRYPCSLSSILTMLSLLFLEATFVTISASTTTAFSLELIHIDNEKSPFYIANLTNQEKHQRLHGLSEYRMRWLESSITNNATWLPTVTRNLRGLLQLRAKMKLSVTGTTHLVKVGIGTPPRMYHLELDTGSDLVWIQCDPVLSGFSQADPRFFPSRSRTYRKVSCPNPLCQPPAFECAQNRCIYNRRYLDSAITGGILSRETFTAPSVHGNQDTTVEKKAFGCSRKTRGSFPPEVAGVVGMDFGPVSFASQLARRFSYCLPERQGVATSLRFDDDIPGPRGTMMASTPIIRQPGKNHFYMNLQDISILGRRLRLSPGTFDIDHRNVGGCVIDGGSSLMHIIRPVYDLLRSSIESYFEQHHLVLAVDAVRHAMRLDLCYVKKQGFRNYPNMVLHFQGADMAIPAKRLFIMENSLGAFCLAIIPSNVVTLIGNYQQRNVRFIYNMATSVLEFGPEDCNAD